MGKIPYDYSQPNMDLLRRAILERLRRETKWHILSPDVRDFEPYIEHKHPERSNVLLFHAWEVIWRLLVEGVLAPGLDSSNPDLPNFHLTEFGRLVVSSEGPNPYDSEQYIKYIRSRVSSADDTVLAYLAESLSTHRYGNIVASTVMLGVAAERIFLLLCESLLDALNDPKDKKDFNSILNRFAIKPKLEWVKTKLEKIQSTKPSGFPENASIMITAIYDLIRSQRNDLGHPRETLPSLTREDAFVSLQIFPRYYETAENVRKFLSNNKI